ncbi:uncharacterized protein LOC119180832 [Rhipicephalus microplus]|uniref:uncharacterized protein LOC119180832 n=1 Tax=Rhipicephalus microplus TaxID=6941 RepID=UPI003F6CFFDF
MQLTLCLSGVYFHSSVETWCGYVTICTHGKSSLNASLRDNYAYSKGSQSVNSVHGVELSPLIKHRDWTCWQDSLSSCWGACYVQPSSKQARTLRQATMEHYSSSTREKRTTRSFNSSAVISQKGWHSIGIMDHEHPACCNLYISIYQMF